MRDTAQPTSVRLSESQKCKLREMATKLDVSINTVLGMLVDNAVLTTVERQEPIARLKRGKDRSMLQQS